MSWQPMSSAPRDGRRFVAGLWIGEGAAARFEMHIVRADPRADRVHADCDRGWAWADYTHWLALPLPSQEPAETPTGSDRPRMAPSQIHRAYGVA